MSWYNPTSWSGDTWKRIGAGVATGGLSEGANYVGNLGAQGAKDAAGNLRATAADAKTTAGQQRDWYMQGAQGAMGYLDPAAAYAQNWSNQGPGSGENAFNSYGSRYLDETANQRWLTNNQAAYNSPGAGEYAYQNLAQNALSQQGDYERNYGNVVGQMQNPGDAERYYGQMSANFSNPTQAASTFGQSSRMLSGPSALGSSYNDLRGQYGARGNLEFNTDAMAGAYDAQTRLQGSDLQKGYRQSGDLEQASRGLAGNLRGGQVQDLYGSQMPGYAEQSATEGMAGAQQGQLARGGQLERFAAQSLTNQDPYYQMLSQEGNASLDQEMASSGAYNSGARMAALAKFQTGLGAQRYHEQGQLQGAAQQATMQRLGQGMSNAQASDQTRYQRMLQAQGLASGASQEQVARTMGQANILNTSDQERMARLTGEQGLLESQDMQQFQRLQGKQSLYAAGDQERMDRLMAQQNLADRMSQDTRANFTSLNDAARGVDTSNQNQWRLGGDLAMNSQKAAQQRYTDMLDAYGKSQAAAMSRYQMQGDFMGKSQDEMIARMNAGSNASDRASQDQRSGLDSYMKYASGAQDLAQRRQQDAYNALYGVGAARAGMQIGAYGKGADIYSDYYGAGLGAQVNAAGMDRAASNDYWASILGLRKLGVDAGKAAG